MTENFNPEDNQAKGILIVIDGQKDFTKHPGSMLPVPGGISALRRTSEFIMLNVVSIDAILVTRDKHVTNHIAHEVLWIGRNGEYPAVYTAITLAEIDAGEYRATEPALQMIQRNYVAELEARGQKTLMIWPPHCIAGTPGYELDPALVIAFAFWEKYTDKKVVYLDKGEHPDTEQYGAFAADVPVAGAPETFTNMKAIDWINSFGTKFWTGLALSHCVMASMQQVFDEASVGNRSTHVLFSDCTASVAGFEKITKDWVLAQRAIGLRVQRSIEDIVE